MADRWARNRGRLSDPYSTRRDITCLERRGTGPAGESSWPQASPQAPSQHQPERLQARQKLKIKVGEKINSPVLVTAAPRNEFDSANLTHRPKNQRCIERAGII